jgi:hypothetical protein
MTLVHRFSVKTFMQHERLQDDNKLRDHIQKGRRHSTDAEMNAFIAVLHSKRGTISGLLRPLKQSVLRNSGARAITEGVMWAAGKDSNLGAASKGLDWVERAPLVLTAVPLAKLYVFSNYELSIHEMQTQNGYRLELRLYGPDGAQLLAHSDEPVSTGPRIKMKAQT